MISQFLNYLYSHIGDIYVWGAQGEIATPKFIEKHETSNTNIERALKLYYKRVGEGRNPIYAFDCSGLIVCYLLDNKLISSDMTANGIYGKCKKLDSRDKLEKGDFVFRYNGTKIHHIGVYVGDNEVIEAYGRDLGVVKRNIDASGKSYWNRYGKFEKLFEDDLPEYPKLCEYSGSTYVNLRTAPEQEIIGKVIKGERVIVLNIENDYADVIKVDNGRYIRGVCIAKYFKEVKGEVNKI